MSFSKRPKHKIPYIRHLTRMLSLLSLSGFLYGMPPAGPIDLPRLRISENGRFLETGDSQPFFWLGDTNWTLFHRATSEEADRYFSDRATKGFTVIQAGICAAGVIEGITDPSHNVVTGELPFHLTNSLPDPAKPNEAFFRHVDQLLDQAAAHGLYVALLPTWAEFVCPKWHNGPKVFTPENARQYGQWLGERYASQTNVLWVIGGNRTPVLCDPDDSQIWRAMAEGISSADKNHLMTYHPQGNYSSDTWFHQDAWLDFNMYQSIRWPENITKLTRQAYRRTPAKPVVNGEPFYFENRQIQEDFDDRVFRAQPYWTFIAGGRGYTFGQHHVWFFDKNDAYLNFEKNSGVYWHEKLNTAGTQWTLRYADIMRSVPWWDMVPDSTLIVSGRGSGTAEVVGCRLPNDEQLMVYFPVNASATIDLAQLPQDTATLTWYKTDEVIEVRQTVAVRQNSLRPPEGWEDALLVVQ